ENRGKECHAEAVNGRAPKTRFSVQVALQRPPFSAESPKTQGHQLEAEQAFQVPDIVPCRTTRCRRARCQCGRDRRREWRARRISARKNRGSKRRMREIGRA